MFTVTGQEKYDVGETILAITYNPDEIWAALCAMSNLAPVNPQASLAAVVDYVSVDY